MRDLEDYPSGPTGAAMHCLDKMADLEAEKATATPERRKAINKHLHTLRHLMRFYKSRAGFVTAAPVDR